MPDNGRRYSTETKRLAYELWRLDRDQTMVELEGRLKSVSVEVPADTLREWRSGQEWERQFEEELVAMSPEMARLHISGLRVGAPEGIEALRAFLRGDRLLSMAQVVAARTLIAEHRVLLQRDPSALQVQAQETSISPGTSVETLLALEEANRQPR